MPELAIPGVMLRPPRLPDHHVSRARLLERLDRGVERQLMLVVAPAGYGKTTLLSAWAAQTSHHVAWLTLDETDDGCSLFIRGFVAAVGALEPDFGRATIGLLGLASLPGATYLAQMLAQELAQLDAELTVVLDDYQVLRDATVHELMTSLLRYLPPAIHLVLGTRDDPPLPLARLRARDQLTELRADELCFSPAETRAWVDRTIQPHADVELASELHRRTGGWAVALWLATTALRDQPDRLAWLRRFLGDEQHLRTFLVDEVLHRQDPPIREFLLDTAILEQVSAPLAEALADGSRSSPDTHALLDQIVRANLLVARDQAGHWYHYHALLRETLLHELRRARGESSVRLLHRRASDWFAEQQLVPEAVHHALAAGDVEAAARLVETHAHALLDREDWLMLEQCLQSLPPDLVTTRPQLLLARCWVLQIRMAYPGLPALLARVDGLVAEVTDPDLATALRGELDALWSFTYNIQGDHERARTHAWRAVETLSPAFLLGWRNAVFFWALASQILGDGDTAAAWMRSQAEARLHEERDIAAHLLGTLALLSLTRGELEPLESASRSALAVFAPAGRATSAAWCRFLLGRLHLLREELTEARAQFVMVLAERHHLNSLVLRESLVALSQCQQAQDNPDAARGTLAMAEEIATETLGFDPQHTLRAARWKLALARGERIEIPRGLPPGTGESIITLTSLSVECPTMVRVRVLLALGDRAAVSEAALLADWLVMTFETIHTPLRLTAALALRSLVRQVQAELTSAFDDLRRAVDLARPRGLIRPFTDLGAPLAGLLADLVAQLPTEERDFPVRLLAAFPTSIGPREPVLPNRYQAERELVEGLTWREAEVLELLAKRCTNKEIGQELSISTDTAKRHVANITRKLQVTNRREAVTRARVLGILAVGNDSYRK